MSTNQSLFNNSF